MTATAGQLNRSLTAPPSSPAVRPLRALLRWGQVPAVGPLQAVDLLWTVFVLAMFVTMLAIPNQETIPYHLIYVSFTLLYGYRLWSSRTTVAVLMGITVVTGVMFTRVYLAGGISWDEMAEIPLMSLIVGGMAWHALRSASARRRVQELAELEGSRLDRQRAFLRDTAHAIRTPVTIARGNIELIQLGSTDPQLLADSAEVLHQLDRLHHMARRLLVIEALHTSDLYAAERVDVGGLVANAARRWSGAAPRNWVLPQPIPAFATADQMRLEESVDAMVENAIRFTEPGGTIRISCRRSVDGITVEVADDGPGIPVEDRERVFDRFFHRHPLGGEPGTGLGLALVAAVAATFGGEVFAGEAPEGGALVRLRLPNA
jgi:signal transduction histidine kinase